MKLTKVITLSAVTLMGLNLVGCGNSSTSKEEISKTSQSSKKSKKQSKTISQNKKLRAKFDNIKVGELSQNGAGGSSLTEVEKSLGTPTSTTSSKISTYKVKDEVWHKDGISIVIQTINDKVISKDITGFKWSGRPEKLTLKEFNKIPDGSSYDSLIQKYGEPDSLHESLLLGKKTTTAIWLTGVKGNSGANVSLTFENDQLISKTQTELK